MSFNYFSECLKIQEVSMCFIRELIIVYVYESNITHDPKCIEWVSLV